MIKFLAICLIFISTAKASFKKPFPNMSFTRPLLIMPYPLGKKMLVVEQEGKAYIFNNKTNVKVKRKFLDISAKVSRAGNEEGLLGFTFSPNFKTDHSIYIYYSVFKKKLSRVSSLKVDIKKEKVIPGSEKVLLEIEQPYRNHNGGMLAFGPDKKLYIGLGDGGSAGDPLGHGQNTKTLLGNILRIEVTKKGYSIPKDNPFINNSSFRPEIYAYGLRNPWRFSFDQKTGDFWVADVGQNELEEIHLVKSGDNLGWNAFEGDRVYKKQKIANHKLPIFTYDHSKGQSITGGFVYRGSNKNYYGKYFYADFVSGNIWALNYQKGKVKSNTLIGNVTYPSSFGEGQDGELYICSFDGSIYKL